MCSNGTFNIIDIASSVNMSSYVLTGTDTGFYSVFL